MTEPATPGWAGEVPPPASKSRQRRSSIIVAVAVAVAVVVLLALGASLGTFRGSSSQAPPPPPSSGFVTRDGMQLKVDGRPFRFVGYNTFVMFGCGHPEENIRGADRDAFFAGLRPNSVVRLSMLPGTDLADMDEVVAAAHRHGQRLVVVLSDNRANCGDTEKDDAFYASGFRGDYLNWVRTVVPRYRDDSTIAMWELVNEPKTSNPETLRTFFDEVGKLVHELDPNHLVSSGTLQPDGLGGVEGFTGLSASPGIDVVSLHEYDASSDVSPHLQPALQAAEAVGKPLIVGEWGLYAGPKDASAVGGNTCFSVDGRASVASAKLNAYLAVPQVAGLLYWSYTADGVRPSDTSCTLSTTKGDPLTDVIRNVTIPIPDA